MEIGYMRLFQHCAVIKLQYTRQRANFCNQVPISSSSYKHKFTIPLKNILILNYCTFKILFFSSQMCQNAQRHKKKLKRRPDMKKHYQISFLKFFKNWCRKFHKIHFLKTVFMFPQVKTQFSLSPKMFLVIGTHLTVA